MERRARPGEPFNGRALGVALSQPLSGAIDERVRFSPDWLTGLKGSSQEGVGAQAASRRRCISSRLAELLVCSLAASRAAVSFDRETLDVVDGDSKTLQ